MTVKQYEHDKCFTCSSPLQSLLFLMWKVLLLSEISVLEDFLIINKQNGKFMVIPDP